MSGADLDRDDMRAITVTAANVEDYVDQLRQGATLHGLRELGEKIAATEDLDTARQLLEEAMARQVERPGVQAMTYADGFARFFDRHDGEQRPPYLSWGVQVLDERIFTEPGDMVVLGGYPSDGSIPPSLPATPMPSSSRARRFPVGTSPDISEFPSTSCRRANNHTTATNKTPSSMSSARSTPLSPSMRKK